MEKHVWVIHVTGADDLLTQAGELEALRLANGMNRMMAEMERDEHTPVCYAIVKNASVEDV